MTECPTCGCEVRTFRGYLAARKGTDDAAGDFAKDARADPGLPNVITWGDLRGYLVGRGVDGGVIKAAKALWEEYKREVPR